MFNSAVNGFSVSLDGDTLLPRSSQQKPLMGSTPPQLSTQPNASASKLCLQTSSSSSTHPYNMGTAGGIAGGADMVSSSCMDQTVSSTVSSRDFSETSSAEPLGGVRAFPHRVLTTQYFNASPSQQGASHLGFNTYLAVQSGNSPMHQSLSRQSSQQQLLQPRGSNLFATQSALNNGVSALNNLGIPPGSFLSLSTAPTVSSGPIQASNTHVVSQQQQQQQQPQQHSSNQAESRSTTNLFVRRLAADVTENELKELFAPYGTVINFVLMRNIHTGRSMRKAFVRFSKPEEAQNAMQALNDMKLKGESISIQWANRQHDTTPAGEERSKIRKVFIRNIPQSVTKEEIEELCRQFGEVSAVSVHADTVDIQANPGQQQTQTSAAQQAHSSEISGGVSSFNNLIRDASESKLVNPAPSPGSIERKNIAFVLYDKDGSAQEAVARLHNTHPFPDIDEGIPLMVKLSEAKKQRMERKKQAATTSSGFSAASAGSNLVWGSEEGFHHSQLQPQQQLMHSASETVSAAMMAGSTSSMYASYSGSATPHSSPSPLPGLQYSATHSPGSQRSSSSHHLQFSTASQQQAAAALSNMGAGGFLASFYDPLGQAGSLRPATVIPGGSVGAEEESAQGGFGAEEVPSPLFVDSRNVSFTRSTSPPLQQYSHTPYGATSAPQAGAPLLSVPSGFECVCIDPSGVVTTISGSGRVGPRAADQIAAFSALLPTTAPSGEAAYPSVQPTTTAALGGGGSDTENAAVPQPSFVSPYYPTSSPLMAGAMLVSPQQHQPHSGGAAAGDTATLGVHRNESHGDPLGPTTYETLASVESFYTPVGASFEDLQTDFEAAIPLQTEFVDPISGSDNDNEDNWEHLNSQQLAALVD